MQWKATVGMGMTQLRRHFWLTMAACVLPGQALAEERAEETQQGTLGTAGATHDDQRGHLLRVVLFSIGFVS